MAGAVSQGDVAPFIRLETENCLKKTTALLSRKQKLPAKRGNKRQTDMIIGNKHHSWYSIHIGSCPEGRRGSVLLGRDVAMVTAHRIPDVGTGKKTRFIKTGQNWKQ